MWTLFVIRPRRVILVRLWAIATSFAICELVLMKMLRVYAITVIIIIIIIRYRAAKRCAPLPMAV